MLVANTTAMHQDGHIQRIETIAYPSGTKVQRTYNHFHDVIPSEVVWLKRVHFLIDPKDVIEHREVQMYNHYFPKK